MANDLVPLPKFPMDGPYRKRNHYSAVTHYCYEAQRRGEIRPTKCRALLLAARTGSDLVFIESRLGRLDIDFSLVTYYRKGVDRCIVEGLNDMMPFNHLSATVQAAATSVQLFLDQLDDGSRKLRGEDHMLPSPDMKEIEAEDW